jgi:long-chain acyl-CoA synthetase
VDLVGVIGIQDPVHGENVRPDLIAFARARVGYKAP